MQENERAGVGDRRSWCGGQVVMMSVAAAVVVVAIREYMRGGGERAALAR